MDVSDTDARWLQLQLCSEAGRQEVHASQPCLPLSQHRTPLHPTPPPQVANRGGALIKKWGRSSAASTAVSIADHLRSLYTPTPAGDCFSTAVYTAGNPYGLDGALSSGL